MLFNIRGNLVELKTSICIFAKYGVSKFNFRKELLYIHGRGYFMENHIKILNERFHDLRWDK